MMEAVKQFEDVGQFVPDYTVLQPARQPHLCSPPREPEILLLSFLFQAQGDRRDRKLTGTFNFLP
jgi:hypothetical protein